MAEMHPSKAQQSTLPPEPASGLRLGFSDIPLNTQRTPTKIGIGSSSFDFRFARPTQLGPEAQRMMDDLREEALKIKAKLAAEREEEKRLAGENTMASRKIAKPKGKVGRFSDIHMAQFKKMDSIADGPSLSRAQAGRIAPAITGLKRTQSKAELEDREGNPIESSLKRTQSKANLNAGGDTLASSSARGPTIAQSLKRTQSRANLNEQPDTQSTSRPTTAQSLKRTQSKVALNDVHESHSARGPTTSQSLKRTQSKAQLLDGETHDQPNRSATAVMFNTPLKRTQSKANLDDRVGGQFGQTQGARSHPYANTLKRTQSRANFRGAQSDEQAASTGRLENTASAKRARQHITDDTSTARPVSRETTHEAKAVPVTPTAPRTLSSLLESITSPTQASLARAATVKQPATQIPTLSRSPSKPSLAETPRGLAKSATVNNLSTIPQPESQNTLRTPSRFDRVKSILRHPSSSMKKPTGIPRFPASPWKAASEAPLPSVPTTPIDGSKSVKHVNFPENAAVKPISTVTNTPVRSGIPRSVSKLNLGSKSVTGGQPLSEIQYPALLQSDEVKYPSLNAVNSRPTSSHQANAGFQPPPSVPSTFTFRSDHTIQFGASPNGFGSSSGQSSVRQVRPSILPPMAMPGSFPESNKENVAIMAAVPHGMSNKKRRRIESDDEEERQAERSPKKQKSVPEGDALMAPKLMAEKLAPASKIPSPAKKGLTMSRLSMLARPKMRK